MRATIRQVQRVLGKEDRNYRLLSDNFNDEIGNFGYVEAQAYKIARTSHDYISSAKSIVFAGSNSGNFLKASILDAEEKEHEMSLSPWALSQICKYEDIPSTYMRHCIEIGDMSCAAYNLNTMLAHAKEKNVLIRETDNRMYGFLSSNYGIFDDIQLLPILRHVIPQQGNFVVKNSLITPDEMKLRIVDVDKFTVNGDELSFAYDISNSRTGRSSVSIKLLIYRWICSNGLIMGGGSAIYFSKQHRGINPIEISSNINLLMAKAPEVKDKVKEWIEASMNHRLDSESLQKIVDEFKKNLFASDIIANNVVAKMNEKYDSTKWGFINAITEVAQTYSVDTREALEKYAGDLLAS